MTPTIKITLEEFKLLAGYIHSHYGIRLKEQKQTLVMSRLHNVLEKAGFENFTDYYHYLMEDKTGEAVIMLIDKITTNHTYFMREADHFYFFRDKVLPYFEAAVKDKDLRIWCAACSTGEEAYTLGMLLDEFFGKDKLFWDTKVLATDISSQVLETAKQGIYESERIAPLPSQWKMNYFKKADEEHYMIKDVIKKEIIFRRFNLVEPVFPFKKKFHVIFCRNVMIYFDNKTKDELIEKFYDQLEFGGYLFIGHSESINRERSRFKYVMPAIYRKE